MADAIVITNQTGAPTAAQNIVLSDGKSVSLDVLAAAVRSTLKIGGRNLLKGSYDGKNWNAQSANGVFTITANSSSETTLFGPALPLEAGKNYVVSLWAKATANMINMDIFLSAVAEGPAIHSISVSQEWKRYVLQKTVSDTAPLTGRFRIDNNGSKDGHPATLWVKEVKVEEGNVATDWSLAPEDVISSLSGGYNALCNRKLSNFGQNRSERSAA